MKKSDSIQIEQTRRKANLTSPRPVIEKVKTLVDSLIGLLKEKIKSLNDGEELEENDPLIQHLTTSDILEAITAIIEAVTKKMFTSKKKATEQKNSDSTTVVNSSSQQITPRPTPDYYKTLGVSRDATQKKILLTYLTRIMKYSQGKGTYTTLNSPEKFQQLGEAFATLKQPESRKEYDNNNPTAGLNETANTDSNSGIQPSA